MNRLLYIFFFILAISCDNTLSEADKKRLAELNERAVEYRMDGDLEKAKELYSTAIDIDPSDPHMRYNLIGIYVQQDSLSKAFELLEKAPKEQKETAYYYQVKAGLFEHNGQKQEAVENFKKALKLTEEPDVNNEKDLMPLVNYAMLETLSGDKDQAVARLNETLGLSWLTESNKEYVATFRNEFEYFQNNGSLEFEPQQDILIKTTNPDSLELILKENHINVSGSSSSGGSDTTKIYISEKYRRGVEKLKIKTHPNNI